MWLTFTTFGNLKEGLDFLVFFCGDSLVRYQGENLGLNLLQLGSNLGHHLVHLGLVLLVQLGQTEGADPSKDDEGKEIEPGADIGEQPEGKAKLYGVHHVLHKEESAQLDSAAVDGIGKAGRDLCDRLSRDSDGHGHHGG